MREFKRRIYKNDDKNDGNDQNDKDDEDEEDVEDEADDEGDVNDNGLCERLNCLKLLSCLESVFLRTCLSCAANKFCSGRRVELSLSFNLVLKLILYQLNLSFMQLTTQLTIACVNSIIKSKKPILIIYFKSIFVSLIEIHFKIIFQTHLISFPATLAIFTSFSTFSSFFFSLSFNRHRHRHYHHHRHSHLHPYLFILFTYSYLYIFTHKHTLLF